MTCKLLRELFPPHLAPERAQETHKLQDAGVTLSAEMKLV